MLQFVFLRLQCKWHIIINHGTTKWFPESLKLWTLSAYFFLLSVYIHGFDNLSLFKLKCLTETCFFHLVTITFNLLKNIYTTYESTVMYLDKPQSPVPI